MIRLNHCPFVAIAGLTFTAACSAPDSGDGVGASRDSVDHEGTSNGGAFQPPKSANGIAEDDAILISEPASEASPVSDGECAASSVETSQVDVVLSFAFDVSASMGSHVEPYYSRAMKWDPVVAATKAFFADPSSEGVSATLTFFPSEGAPSVASSGLDADADTDLLSQLIAGVLAGGALAAGGGAACTPVDYATPNVEVTPLPSTSFAAAIDAVTPADDAQWRLGTPTGPALEGTIQMIRDLQQQDANSKYVIVLVTDGDPALCDPATDSIDTVAGIARAVADEIPTYVIGVANPVTTAQPNPPDDTGNLHQIAEAGGTDQAFIIDTNDPVQTSADFRTVIETIQEKSFACALEIPPPPAGQVFNKEKVNVNYVNTMGETPFVYDPSCTEQFAWYYDDVDNPTVIQMCDAVCEAIKADNQNQGSLNVEFGCLRKVGTAR